MKMPIPDDWDEVSKCRFAICWPDSPKWKAILFGLISSPSQGRFWDEATGYIKGVQAAFSPYYVENFNFKEVIMACGDTAIADAIQAIASAIVTASANSSSNSSAIASACCEETIILQQGGIQGVLPGDETHDPVTYYGTQPPLSVTPETFPEGYDSLEDYKLDKCQVANLIIDGLEGTLHGLGALGIFNAVALAGLIVAAIVGIIAFPPALIPIAGAAIGVLSIEVTVLEGAKTYIEDHRQDWVCALYMSDGVEDALGAVRALIEVLIAALDVTGPVGIAIQTIIIAILNTDTLNKMFHKVAHLQYPDADCSACEGCHTIFYPPAGSPRGEMTIIVNSGTVFEAEGAPYSDRLRWDWAVMINGTGFTVPCGLPPTITLWEVTAGAIDGSIDTSPSVKVYDGAGTVLYSDTVLPTTFPDGGMYFEAISGVDVTLRIEWTWND